MDCLKDQPIVTDEPLTQSEATNQAPNTETDATVCVDTDCATNSIPVPAEDDCTMGTSGSAFDYDDERPTSIYHIKWISHDNKKTPVVTQNENGPCPLIAIINVLILKGKVKLPSTVDIVSSDKLLHHLSDCMLDGVPKNLSEGTQLNYEQNIHDAMSILPKLQTGLDVNVKFTGIRDFEYTPECIIFDLLGIHLLHGWLVDPQTPDVVKAVGKHGYNQLVEKIINNKTSSDSELVSEALLAEHFLEKTASQLTYHGLCELTSLLNEEELCVLFRNNHFTSVVKHNNLLYQLVTDQGFLNEFVVWESLNSVEGDSQFVDGNFVLLPPKSPASDNVCLNQRIDQDFLVALSLEEEQKVQQKHELEWEEFKQKNFGENPDDIEDEELARRLQEAENCRTACRVQPTSRVQQSTSQSQSNDNNNTNSNNGSGRSKTRDCTIL